MQSDAAPKFVASCERGHASSKSHLSRLCTADLMK